MTKTLAQQAQPSSNWTEADVTGTCRHLVTFVRDRRAMRAYKPCSRLSCTVCGPQVRQRDYEAITGLFALQPALYLTTVDRREINAMRLRFMRLDLPAVSVPIGPEENVVFTNTPVDGFEPATDEDVRRLFLLLRIPKRQLTRWGSWKKESGNKNQSPKGPKVRLDVGFVSSEAWRNVATKAGSEMVTVVDQWRGGTEESFIVPKDWSHRRLEMELIIEQRRLDRAAGKRPPL